MSEKALYAKKGKKCTFNVCPDWVVDSLVLVHFGSPAYKPEFMLEIKNNDWVKPKGGLWTSPIKSDYGWFDWCKSNDFRTKQLESSFNIKLRKGSKIAIIDSIDDLIKLPKAGNYLDFEIISNKFDAIWLTVKGQAETRHSKPFNLYGWDCESVLVTNKESVYLPNCI